MDELILVTSPEYKSLTQCQHDFMDTQFVVNLPQHVFTTVSTMKLQVLYKSKN